MEKLKYWIKGYIQSDFYKDYNRIFRVNEYPPPIVKIKKKSILSDTKNSIEENAYDILNNQ